MAGSTDGEEGAMESDVDVKISELDKINLFDDVQFESSILDTSMASFSKSGGCCIGGGVIGASMLMGWGMGATS